MKNISKIIAALLVALLVTCCNSNESNDYLPKKFVTAYKHCKNRELDSALILARQMRQDTTLVPFADMIEAWRECYLGNRKDSYKFATNALNRLNNLVDSALDPKYLEQRAEMELLSGYDNIAANADTAIYYLLSSEKKFDVTRSVQNLIKNYLYLSETYKDKRDFINSLYYLNNIQELCDSVKILNSEPSWVLYTLSDIANMATEIGDARLANNILQLASLYVNMSEDEAVRYYYYEKAKFHLVQEEYRMTVLTTEKHDKMAEKHNEYGYLSESYILHGLALARMHKYDEAQQYMKLAVNIRPNQYYGAPIKESILLEGEIAAGMGDFKRAHYLLFDSVRSDNRIFQETLIYESQKQYYILKNDYQSAFKIQNLKTAYSDSITANIISKSEADKLRRSKFTAASIRNELNEVRAELSEMQQDQTTERITFGALLLLTISWLLISIRNGEKHYKRRIRKEHIRLENEIADKMAELKHQKEMLQITNNRISQSITYAEHIQHSIIPRPDALEMCDITGSFIFYSPLDIVSGDFYWFAQNGDHLIVCCADCTGHGVPGAFMSMIASTAINDIVTKHKEDIAPSQILELLDQTIIATLGQNQTADGTAHDGCDISCISLNVKTKELRVSSAKRPVIVIRDQEMIQVNGTKRSIGDTEPIIHDRPFTDTTIQLHTNDNIYMYSDGYSDQFGGKDGSKMKNNKIKGFLRAIHDDDMDEQGLTMQDFFTQWKGDQPQTDDVLFMGIKV